MKKFAILTGGGDAPGLNAVIRAAVKTAAQFDCTMLGVRDGFDGFLNDDGIFPLGLQEVRGILPRGGTILGTANRGNPFARKVVRDGQTVIEDVSALLIERIRAMQLDGLIVVGGDGVLTVFLQQAGHTFAAGVQYPLTNGDDAFQIEVVDVNGDGLPDLVTTAGPTSTLVNGVSVKRPGVLLQDAAHPGTFGPLTDLP